MSKRLKKTNPSDAGSRDPRCAPVRGALATWRLPEREDQLLLLLVGCWPESKRPKKISYICVSDLYLLLLTQEPARMIS